MSDDKQRWQQVGVWVRSRMAVRGWRQVDLCNATGFVPETVRPFEKGQPNTRKEATRTRIAKALGGPADAIERILAGEDPLSLPDAGTVPQADGPDIVAWMAAMNEKVDAIAEQVVQMAEQVEWLKRPGGAKGGRSPRASRRDPP